MQQLVKIILYTLILNIAYADPELTVYFCVFTDGTMGYYDHPCNYILNTKHHLGVNSKLLKAKTLNLKITRSSHKQHNYLLTGRVRDQPAAKVAQELQLAKQRCERAISKIPLLQQTIAHLSATSKEKLKFNRSLSRYRRIAKKYCVQDRTVK